MLMQIYSLIRLSQGYVYERAGTISGFFDDPSQARICATLLRTQLKCEVEICGCELSVSM